MAAHVIIWGLPDNIPKNGLENIVKVIRSTFKEFHFDPEKIAVWMPKDLLPWDLGDNIGIFVEGLNCDMIDKPKQCSDGYEDLPDKIANALLDLVKNVIISNYVEHCKELDIFVRDLYGNHDDDNARANWRKPQPGKGVTKEK